MSDPTPPAEDTAEDKPDGTIVGVACARFGVSDPDGRILRVWPGDPIPAWMVAKIAPANWTDEAAAASDTTAQPAMPKMKPSDNWVPGSVNDPRLDGHPGIGATVDQVMDWVRASDNGWPLEQRAEAALEREHGRGSGRVRRTLTNQLTPIIDGEDQ